MSKNNKIVFFAISILIVFWSLVVYISMNRDKTSTDTNSQSSNIFTWNVDTIEQQEPVIEEVLVQEDLETKIKSNCENSSNMEFCIDSEINSLFLSWEKDPCSKINENYKSRCIELLKLKIEAEIQTEQFKKSIKEEKKSPDQEYLDQAISTNNKKLCDKIVDKGLKDFCKLF